MGEGRSAVNGERSDRHTADAPSTNTNTSPTRSAERQEKHMTAESLEQRVTDLEAHCAALQHTLDQVLCFVQTVAAGAGPLLAAAGESGVQVDQDLALIGTEPRVGVHDLGERQPIRYGVGGQVPGES